MESVSSLRLRTLAILADISHWLMMYRLDELKAELAKWERKYDPNEPRVPAGNHGGGEWTVGTGTNGGDAIADSESSDGVVAEALDSLVTGLTNDEIAEQTNWGNAKTLQDHFERHGDDFNSESAEEYANQAQEFRLRAITEKLPALEYPGGEIGTYDPETNTFGVYNTDGTTATFYKPPSKNYFQNQINKYVLRGGRVINPLPQDEVINPTPKTEGVGTSVEDGTIPETDFFLE